MNIEDLEKRILEKEFEMLNNQHFYMDYEVKFKNIENKSDWITFILYPILYAVLYFIFVGPIMFKGSEFLLFILHSICLLPLLVIGYTLFVLFFADVILKILCKLFYKDISKKEYVKIKKNFGKLRKELSHFDSIRGEFQKIKHFYNEYLTGRVDLNFKEKVITTEFSLWETNQAYRKNEFELLNIKINFEKYEEFRRSYFDLVKSSIEDKLKRIEAKLSQIESNCNSISMRMFSEGKEERRYYVGLNSIDLNLRFRDFEHYLEYRIAEPINSTPKFPKPRTSSKRNFGLKIPNGQINQLNINEKITKPYDSKRHIDNIILGEMGELFVLEFEKENLYNTGRSDLAEKVNHISKELGDVAGYDILTYDDQGCSKKIEVKTTSGEINDDFYLTENEYKTMINSDNYYIYRVYNFNVENNNAKIKVIHCAAEMSKYNLDVSMYFITPNKLLI